MSSVVIKEYQKQHQQPVIDLILSIQNHEFDLPVTLNDQPDLETVATFYQKNKGNFWVAIVDDKIIGTIALIDIGNSQTALRKMFVAKDFRGKDKQVAQLLLETAIDWCKINNIQEIYLGTVAILLAAHRFYEKNGFNEISKLDLPNAFPVMKLDTKFYVLEIK